MTKPITSALILMLMEEGKLRLEDPIVNGRPNSPNRRVLRNAAGPIEDTYPAPRDITVEDLLSHRSGIAYAFSSTGPIAEAYGEALGDERIRNFGPDEFLAALASLPLVDAPGERWRYGHSTDVLGFIAERIEGKPFRDLLLERILQPLGMSRHGLLDTARQAGSGREDLCHRLRRRAPAPVNGAVTKTSCRNSAAEAADSSRRRTITLSSRACCSAWGRWTARGS